MGVVTASSSAARTSAIPPLGRGSSRTGRPATIVAFKTDRTKCSAVTAAQQPATIPLDKQPRKSKPAKRKPRTRKADADELDYNEVAAALENLYKISPGADVAEEFDRKRRKEEGDHNVVRNKRRRQRRPSLGNRVEMRRKRSGRGEIRGGFSKEEEGEEVEKLVREYSTSTTDLVSMDWKRMKIPPVLGSSEHTRLFKLMQPVKVRYNYPIS